MVPLLGGGCFHWTDPIEKLACLWPYKENFHRHLFLIFVSLMKITKYSYLLTIQIKIKINTYIIHYTVYQKKAS